MNSRFDEHPMAQVIKRLGKIESALRNPGPMPTASVSENTPAILMADQNDYDPGNFDVLRMSSNAIRTITGISGGRRGRWLTIFNVGSFSITLSVDNLSSLNENRLASSTSADVTIAPGGKSQLYYDATILRWRM